MFRKQFAIDVRTRCEAVAISPKEKTVTLRNVETGEETTESYDKLVLSPGAACGVQFRISRMGTTFGAGYCARGTCLQFYGR